MITIKHLGEFQTGREVQNYLWEVIQKDPALSDVHGTLDYVLDGDVGGCLFELDDEISSEGYHAEAVEALEKAGWVKVIREGNAVDVDLSARLRELFNDETVVL